MWKGSAGLCIDCTDGAGRVLLVLQGKPDEVPAWAIPAGGLLLLRDFHPVAEKPLDPDGGGDYFDTALRESPIACRDLLPAANLLPVRLRRWTLGAIVTAVAGSGFYIRRLHEEPHADPPAFPGWLTLLARS